MSRRDWKPPSTRPFLAATDSAAPLDLSRSSLASASDRQLFGFFLRQQPKHLDAHLTLLRRTDEPDLVCALLKCGNHSDRLISCRRFGRTNISLVLTYKSDRIRHRSLPAESRAKRRSQER